MTAYLDHAATTKVCSAAVSAMVAVMTEEYGNPSSLHQMGLRAGTGVKAGRAEVAQTLACDPEEIVFTSGGTESDNWAIFSGASLGSRRGKHIITTAIEHSAVINSMKELEKQGFEVTYLTPGTTGTIDVKNFEAALREDTVLVSTMLVNNETGAILPVGEISKIIRRRGSSALLHTDAVQGFLKLPVTEESLGAQMISVSAHKIGGPKGIGALYIQKGVRLRPLLFGGGQESGLRPGTEATAQIAGFAAACREGRVHLEENAAHMHKLKKYALERLQTALPELCQIGAGEAPHILSISLPGYRSEVLVRYLGDHGVCVSAGSACHRGKPSHVFAAQKLPTKVMEGALRVSFGPDNTREEIDALCTALMRAKENLFPSL